MARIGLQGENLIFLISQPRAGSTLLQRMMGSHPGIHTVSEPWLMLHPLYSLRAEGYEAEYDANGAWRGMQSFVETLPDGEDTLIEGMRRMYSHLYHQALRSSGRRYFLDKTPRYYNILPELQRVFPRAQYIILLRNPLAVLNSIIDVWIQHWFALNTWRQDLVLAPRLLLAAQEMLGDQVTTIHYEQLVKNPICEMQRICEKLQLEFEPTMINYGDHGLPHWRFGDQKEVYQHTQPTYQSTEKWVHAIDDPQTWRLASDYLQLLGKETVERMGYSYESLWRVLQVHRPHRIRQWITFPMTRLVKKPATQYSRLTRSFLLLAGLISRQGIRGAWTYAIRRARRLRSKP